MDDDLSAMSAQELIAEWPEFIRGCVRHRQSLDEQAPDAPRTSRPYEG